jgi:transcriptional regulator of heat shock response
MNVEKQHLTAVMCLASAQVLLECMDELQDTPFYKQSLKQLVKRLEKELLKVLDDDISKMYKIDEEVMRMIQNGIEAISKQMATTDPTRIAMLGQLLEDGSITFEDV